MNPDILFAAVMYVGLLIFYVWNEPKARQQDEKRRQVQNQRQNEQQRIGP